MNAQTNGNGHHVEFQAIENNHKAMLSGFKITKRARSIMYVSEDPHFYISDDNKTALKMFDKLSNTSPQNVMLTGPHGCGKTELCIWFAAKFKRPVIIMNCATIRETKDWFGFRTAENGSVFWHKSDFVRAVELGNCVIILDEFNRLHSSLHNSLYPLLDARRSTFLEEIEEIISVGPNTIFFATCNIGFNHTGTHTMDSAIEDRFSFKIEVDFPSEEIEKDIIKNKIGLSQQLSSKLAKFGKNIRAKSIGVDATLSRSVSTRQLLQLGILIKLYEENKQDLKKAIDYTIIPSFSKEGMGDSERAQILQLVQGIFGK